MTNEKKYKINNINIYIYNELMFTVGNQFNMIANDDDKYYAATFAGLREINKSQLDDQEEHMIVISFQDMIARHSNLCEQYGNDIVIELKEFYSEIELIDIYKIFCYDMLVMRKEQCNKLVKIKEQYNKFVNNDEQVVDESKNICKIKK